MFYVLNRLEDIFYIIYYILGQLKNIQYKTMFYRLKI